MTADAVSDGAVSEARKYSWGTRKYSWGIPAVKKPRFFSKNHIDEAKTAIHRAFSIIRLTKRKKKHKIVGGKIKREDFQR